MIFNGLWLSVAEPNDHIHTLDAGSGGGRGQGRQVDLGGVDIFELAAGLVEKVVMGTDVGIEVLAAGIDMTSRKSPTRTN